MDPYAVLGVGRSATAAEIREAYLRRSKELHPDRLVGATDAQRAMATRAMQDVIAAYEMLRDRRDAEPPPSSAPSWTPPVAHAPAWTPPAPSSRRTRYVVIGLAVLAVMSGLVLSGGGSKPAPNPGQEDDLTPLTGKCLTLEPSRKFKEIVDCTAPHDARVVQVVDHGVACPIYADSVIAGSRQDLCLEHV